MASDADFLSDDERTKLSDAEMDQWFGNPPAPPPHTFELALVLGGTVSAGAYTAGALDFLIEALDAWTARRDAGDDSVPRHKVVLRVVTGTSGGGVNAAIAARALNCDFAPVSAADAVLGGATGNPFYDTWVDTLTLDGFLATDDLGHQLVSLLNGAPIDTGKRGIAQFPGKGVRQTPRPWVAAPLGVILTLSNLRGVPYRLGFPGELEESYVDHADCIRYALRYDGQPAGPLRPDELALGFAGASPQDWLDFAQFACATAAFPAGFPPRELARPTLHYRYRVIRRAPTDPAAAVPGAPPYVALEPDWDALGAPRVPRQYRFLTVDGGATDNEPIELARTALCGIAGSNPRAGDKANRAVLLIDPFAGKTGLGPDQAESLAPVLGAIVNAVLQQTRYDSRDLVLAADPDVMSRFMLTPRRAVVVDGNADSVVGDAAIASSGLGAFIGFSCPEFMRHDYLLGRKNCQDFLRDVFTLDATNPVFDLAGKPPPAGQLPIIPLVDGAARPQSQPAWPSGVLNPERYRKAIDARVRAVFKEQAGWLGAVAGRFVQGKIADLFCQAVNAYMARAKLF